MDPNILWAVIVGAIAAIAGYLFGMADSRVTNAFKESRAKDLAAKETPANEAATKEADTARLDEHTVMRITVDPALKWHLELDGSPLEPEGLSAEQRARLVNVIVQIRPWIDGKSTGAALPSAPVVAPVPAPVAAYTPSRTTPVVRAEERSGPPRLDPMRGFRSLLDSDVVKPESVKGPSIVSMIDDVLQRKLESSPFSGKRIRLEEGTVGEVVVFVGAERFSGVDSVPDEAIRALIRAAIAEWNQG